ncbi:endonuclease/exonuclease/phosphatase family protein [Streptomyces atroolivaceus]|uniref:Endonuclease/exonuclease/phosphatase family protein n=1 Tax=Streptomyces atroolivaceus TaxID=66869 RepID=A0ABV9V442_STRAZ|nr:endonuclease/exonuclease/phosphatase family protein [Streptomyces atroolivaceus]
MTKKPDARKRGWSRRRGRAVALLCLLVAVLLVRPGLVPNTPGRVGSLLETFLPWLGLAVPVLLVPALLRRSFLASAALLLPVAAWSVSFGGLVSTGDRPAEGTFTVVQHNVSDVNPDPAATARALAGTDAGLIALEELTATALPAFEAALAADHPHHATRGTVGLWSKYPLSDARLVDIRPSGVGEGWNRGLRATARTPRGEVAVYVAHLPSVRIGPATGLTSGRRDESAVLLAEAIAAEPLERVILLGDLNGTLDDRGLEPVGSLMSRPGPGFAFSWPAGFPVARIDQVLARSATVTRVRSLPATGSDHLPVAADIKV